MNGRRILTLAALFTVAVVFWNTFALTPVKSLVVLFHELSHGLAAVATGGRITKIELSAHFGGICYFTGGWSLLTLPAGYLGSMLWGALLLLVGRSPEASRPAAGVLGFFLLGMTLLYVRTPLGILVGLSWGLALIVLARRTSGALTALVLEFVGISSMLYAILDIKEDLIDRTVAISDAARFAQIYGGPPVLWGVIWIGIALVATFFTLRVAVKSR
jgi:hypothetical protein